MLTIQNLSVKIDDNTIIDDLSFSIEDHSVTCIIGASGIGKSTLIKTIAGIHYPTAGSIRYRDELIDNRKIDIGYAFQDYGLYPWYTVHKNIILPMVIKKHSIDKCFLQHILSNLGIEHLLDRYPSDLSGGEQQRVALARAIVLKPQILLLDEPFSALDTFNRNKARALFLKVWEEVQSLCLFVTHDIDEALHLSHKILIIKNRSYSLIDNTVRGKQKIDPEYIELFDSLQEMIIGSDSQ